MNRKKLIVSTMICLIIITLTACSSKNQSNNQYKEHDIIKSESQFTNDETTTSGQDTTESASEFEYDKTTKSGQNTTQNTSKFKEDWYLEHCYYIDSNGDYFALKYSDTILQIDIADVGHFNVRLSKYKIENNNEYGKVYVYYDIDSYALVKYYPHFDNTIIIESETGEIVCTNISESEYLEAERNFANSQLEGFDEIWYKDKYLSYDTYEWNRDFLIRNDYTFDKDKIELAFREIRYKQITDNSSVFTLQIDPVFDTMSEKVTVDFFSDEYEINYDNYSYVYKSTNLDLIVYLEYFPKDNKVTVYDEYDSIGGGVITKKTYYLLTKEDIEKLSMIN